MVVAEVLEVVEVVMVEQAMLLGLVILLLLLQVREIPVVLIQMVKEALIKVRVEVAVLVVQGQLEYNLLPVREEMDRLIL
jgi:hypothetical protein